MKEKSNVINRRCAGKRGVGKAPTRLDSAHRRLLLPPPPPPAPSYPHILMFLLNIFLKFQSGSPYYRGGSGEGVGSGGAEIVLSRE